MPFSKEKYYQKKDYIIDHLGGKCEHCGTKDNLQFAHINPETKIACVSELLHHSIDIAVEEAEKCFLLCESCHYKYDYPEREHGTLTMYTSGKCRCVDCKAANALYMKKYRARNKTRRDSKR